MKTQSGCRTRQPLCCVLRIVDSHPVGLCFREKLLYNIGVFQKRSRGYAKQGVLFIAMVISLKEI